MPGPEGDAERSLSAIVEAAERVLRVQGRSGPEKQRAFQALFEASSQPNPASGYFSAPAPVPAPRSIDRNEALVAARFELRSAQLLAAASVMAGETTPVGDAVTVSSFEEVLDDAKAELVEEPAKKAFRGKMARGEPSSDLGSAVENFRSAANRTLDSVVGDSDKAVSKALDAIKDKQKDVLAAFDGIAQLFSAGAQLEGLIKAAWEKLQSGLRLLSETLKDIPFDNVREQITKLKNAATVKNALEFAYQTEETHTLVDALRVRPELTEYEIDDRRDALAQIGQDFSSFVKTALIVSGIASAVVGLIGVHLTGPLGLMAVPATHALVIAVVLAAGIVINNAWITVRKVHGIRDSLQEISVLQMQQKA